MNGIENIISHIREKTNQEVEKIINASQETCEKIRKENKITAQEEYGKAFKAGAVEVTKFSEKLAEVAEREAKRQVMREKQKYVSMAFSQAKSRILHLPENEYVEFLIKLTIHATETGNEALEFSELDRKKVGETVCSRANAWLLQAGKQAELTVSPKTRDIEGGVVLIRDDFEIDRSIEKLCNELQAETGKAMAGMLFEKNGL